MSRFRTARLSLLAVFVASAVAASVAFAADAGQEFNKVPLKPGFTETSGKSVLRTSSITVTCQKGKDTGTVTSVTGDGKIVATFEGCEVEEAKSKCKSKINSPGAKNAGEIVTSALKGELGESAEAKSNVAALAEPEESAKGLATLEETKEGAKKCTPLTKVTGSFAPEVSATKGKVYETEIICELEASKKPAIKNFESSNDAKKVKPKLSAFGVEATTEGRDKGAFSEEIEIKPGE